MIFHDRTDAGKRLAERLAYLRGQDLVVLGLPRGGVVVAYEVASVLDAPLDVVVVKKLGVPFQPELAMGAIGEGDICIVNSNVVTQAGIDETVMEQVKAQERAELEWRAALYREQFPRVDIRGRVAVVVDDGVATGSTTRAACEVAKAHGAMRVVLAVPVAPRELCVMERSQAEATPTPVYGSADQGGSARLSTVANEVVCLEMPRGVFAVGQYYEDFSQVTDVEVMDLLGRARRDVPDL